LNKIQQLSIDNIKEKIGAVRGWKIENNSIQKEYILKNFSEALAFIIKIGIEAEKMDHHPDLLLYGWNKVKVILSTHSAGGITDNDFLLAQQIDNINQ
jgi:4a-hydroxytetrahydrobiopterin dehydratase